MRAEIVTLTDLRVGRIQDKTRWTKALGEAATIVYGDCKEDICQSRHRTAVGHETSGHDLSFRRTAARWRNGSESGLRRGEAMKHGAPMRWLWYRAWGRHASWVVDRSLRRIPWCRNGQVGKEDQSSRLA